MHVLVWYQFPFPFLWEVVSAALPDPVAVSVLVTLWSADRRVIRAAELTNPIIIMFDISAVGSWAQPSPSDVLHSHASVQRNTMHCFYPRKKQHSLQRLQCLVRLEHAREFAWILQLFVGCRYTKHGNLKRKRTPWLYLASAMMCWTQARADMIAECSFWDEGEAAWSEA